MPQVPKPNGQKSKYSAEAYKKLTDKKYEYRKKSYIQKSMRLKPSVYEAYKNAASSNNMSLNEWVVSRCLLWIDNNQELLNANSEPVKIKHRNPHDATEKANVSFSMTMKPDEYEIIKSASEKFEKQFATWVQQICNEEISSN